MLDEIAWYGANSGGSVHPVGHRPPTPWGLFDMQGNVLGWCVDPNLNYTPGATVEPGREWRHATQRFSEALLRTVRGGYFDSSAERCRSAYRSAFDRFSRFDGLGIRLVRPV